MSPANGTTTAPQNRAEGILETLAEGTANDPYLFTQVIDGFVEFLVNAIGQKGRRQSATGICYNKDLWHRRQPFPIFFSSRVTIPLSEAQKMAIRFSCEHFISLAGARNIRRIASGSSSVPYNTSQHSNSGGEHPKRAATSTGSSGCLTLYSPVSR